jgi:hypothetical protein
MRDFRDTLSFCDLHDMGFVGTPWTWDNKQKGERNVKVRLDRAVANPAWSTSFPDYMVRHISSSRSDHTPLLMSIEQAQNCRTNRPIRRYEVSWEREPSLVAEVEEAWSRRLPVHDLGAINSSLKDVMGGLYNWKAAHFKYLPKEIEKKRAKLEELHGRDDETSNMECLQLTKEIDELLYREEIAWHQRSRVTWLREGDQNTKFFHRQASKRQKKNKIRKLRRADGSWTMDSNEMEKMASDFFQKLYRKDESVNPEGVTNLVQEVIDENMNEKLCAAYSVKEISDALFR